MPDVAFAVPGFGRQVAKVAHATFAGAEKWPPQIIVPMVYPFAIACQCRAESIGCGGVNTVVDAAIGCAMGRAKYDRCVLGKLRWRGCPRTAVRMDNGRHWR